MSFDTFKAEQKAIERAQSALENLDTVDLEAEFRELLIAYIKTYHKEFVILWK